MKNLIFGFITILLSTSLYSQNNLEAVNACDDVFNAPEYQEECAGYAYLGLPEEVIRSVDANDGFERGEIRRLRQRKEDFITSMALRSGVSDEDLIYMAQCGRAGFDGAVSRECQYKIDAFSLSLAAIMGCIAEGHTESLRMDCIDGLIIQQQHGL